MKVKLSELDTVANDTVDGAKGSTDIVKPESRELVKGGGLYEVEGVTGEIRSTHRVTPYMVLVGPKSSLREEFKAGHFVVDKEFSRGTEVSCVVFGVHSYLQEVQDFDSDSGGMPQRFRTLQAANEAGFTLSWDTDLPRVEEAADLLLLCEAPEDLDDIYVSVKIGDRGYVPVIYSVSGGSWRGTARYVLDGLRTFLCPERGGLTSVMWKLTWNERSRGKNTWYSPRLIRKGPTPPEVQEWIKEHLL